jgi:hypothetical protein
MKTLHDFLNESLNKVNEAKVNANNWSKLLGKPGIVEKVMKESGCSNKDIVSKAIDFCIDSEEYLVNGYATSFSVYAKNWLRGKFEGGDDFTTQWLDGDSLTQKEIEWMEDNNIDAYDIACAIADELGI